MFQHNLLEQIDKGVTVTNLFKSKIFYHNIDFTEWPDFHESDIKMFVPYSQSILNLRMRYNQIFSMFDEYKCSHAKPINTTKNMNVNKLMLDKL